MSVKVLEGSLAQVTVSVYLRCVRRFIEHVQAAGKHQDPNRQRGPSSMNASVALMSVTKDRRRLQLLATFRLTDGSPIQSLGGLEWRGDGGATARSQARDQ